MSITINDHTPAACGRPPIKPGILGTLCAAWRRWRARLCTPYAFFTAALIFFVLAACTTSGGAASTAASAANSCPGSISIAWSITNANGQPSSCSQVGATSVALRLQSRTGGTPLFTAFPCASSPGTANVEPGLYDVAIELHDANGAKLAVAPPQTSVAVAIARTKVLTPVVFTVGSGGGGGGGNHPGSVLLSLRAGEFNANCLPGSVGGASISGITITLISAASGCAPVTFIRNQGGREIGTYLVNCSSPQVTSCIENDEVLTSPDLTPGRYAIHVRGKIGALGCFAADATLDVPQTGQLQQQIVLQHQNIPGC